MAKVKKFRAKYESSIWRFKGYLFIKGEEVHFKPDFGGNSDNLHIDYTKINSVKKWKFLFFTKGIRIKMCGGTRKDPAPIYDIEVKKAGKIIKMINRRIDAVEKMQEHEEYDAQELDDIKNKNELYDEFVDDMEEVGCDVENTQDDLEYNVDGAVKTA